MTARLRGAVFALLAGAVFGAAAADASAARGSAYAVRGTCAGYPRVELKTPPGRCVALVAGAADGLRFPRRILEVAPDRYWIVDMGSWEPRRGRLLEMTLGGGRAQLRVLADRLDRPLGLVRGPDGLVYVGDAGRVWRTPVADAVVPETVIDKLPDDGAHPLKELAFGADGRLYINVGSSSDACRDERGAQAVPCPDLQGERPRAAVWVAVLGGAQRTLQSLRPYATGLRNSVALAALPGTDTLLQGENSIDYPQADQPPEELNLLQPGRQYGWPYCVGARVPARGYEGRYDCASTEPPLLRWPAHAAPLQMTALPKDAAGGFAGQLLVVWHGYRPAGHRVIGYTLDAQAKPVGEPVTWVAGWDAAAGVRPLGAPTGAMVDHAGRLWIVEDRNRTVLMMPPGQP